MGSPHIQKQKSSKHFFLGNKLTNSDFFEAISCLCQFLKKNKKCVNYGQPNRIRCQQPIGLSIFSSVQTNNGNQLFKQKSSKHYFLLAFAAVSDFLIC